MVLDKNKYKKSTTLIIPCVSQDIYKLEILLKKLGSNKYFLNKIILVFNDIDDKSKLNQVQNINIETAYLNIIRKKRLNPGAARNLGFQSIVMSRSFTVTPAVGMLSVLTFVTLLRISLKKGS